MATPADVRVLLHHKLQEGIPNPPGEFHPLDLERVKDDNYLKRILKHQNGDAKLSANMLWDILVWRKTVQANEINESNIRMDYVEKGIFYPRGRDLTGALLLIIKCKHHVKGEKDFEELKKIIIYWFDRIEREENGKPLTLFFDMDGCGVNNMDVEMIKYFILLMKQYYPCFLQNIIIYHMPWILNATFKLIKTMLPAAAVEKMRFVNKDNLTDVIALDQAWIGWGGEDRYVFQFVPEVKSSDGSSRKVTFAEPCDNQHSPGEMLKIIPHDVIVFKSTSDDEFTSQITITNMDESAVSFKIRTTSPEKFKVKPSMGTLATGASQTILISLQPGYQLSTVSKDRFLILSIQIPNISLSPKELTEIWQNAASSKVDEYRLKCHYPVKTALQNLAENKNEKLDSVASALNSLRDNYNALNKQVKYFYIFQIITIILIIAALFLGFITYPSNHYCNAPGFV